MAVHVDHVVRPFSLITIAPHIGHLPDATVIRPNIWTRAASQTGHLGVSRRLCLSLIQVGKAVSTQTGMRGITAIQNL